MIHATEQKKKKGFGYTMLENGHKTPLEHWLVDGPKWPALQSKALMVFSMVTSSAASGRNFSSMRFIHSKLRNSLSTKSVEKLVFIECNMDACFDNTIEVYDEMMETDGDSDSVKSGTQEYIMVFSFEIGFFRVKPKKPGVLLETNRVFSTFDALWS